MSIKVLVIEDELEVQEVLLEALASEGFTCEAIANPLLAADCIQSFKPDVVTIDKLMPGISGQQLIQKIRNMKDFSDLPIIMISGLGAESDKVEALNLGADDYITKPFYPTELAARINSLLRRAGKHPSKASMIEYDNIRIDVSAHEVFYRDQVIKMTLTEFKILKELLMNPNTVLTRDELKIKVLNSLNVTDRTIDVHIAALRRKLAEKSESIKSVRGVGYKYSA